MTRLWTIAIDGDIGYFATYRTKAAAQREADIWQRNHPRHVYTVEREEPSQAAYAVATKQVAG